MDPFICLVSYVESLLRLRQGIDMAHNFLFREDKAPLRPLCGGVLEQDILGIGLCWHRSPIGFYLSNVYNKDSTSAAFSK